jgi:Dephospho-CoA kinase
VNQLPKIALVGVSRVGKDTVAELLKQQFKSKGVKFNCLAFGDSVKDTLHATATTLQRDPKPISTYVEYAQFMRSIDPNIWIKHLEKKYWKMRELTWSDDFIVTDCRQMNEAKWLKDRGFIIIKVSASIEVRQERSMSLGETTMEEISDAEREINSIPHDFTIFNNGSIKELQKQVEVAVDLVETMIKIEQTKKGRISHI